MSVPTTVVDEKTGEEKKRLINKARWKGYGPTSVSFAEKGVERVLAGRIWHRSSNARFFSVTKVPTKPPTNVEEVRNQYDQTLVLQLEEVGVSLRRLYARRCQLLSASFSRHGRCGPVPPCSTNSRRPKHEKFTSVFQHPLRVICDSSLITVVVSSKVFLPLTCYVFGDGPWRDTMVRFGYDPRQDPQARLSARIAALAFRCADLRRFKLSKAILPKS